MGQNIVHSFMQGTDVWLWVTSALPKGLRVSLSSGRLQS